jgi:hypothetical protein
MGNTKLAVENMGDCQNIEDVAFLVSTANVGGVGIVTVTWASPFQAIFDGIYHTIAAGHIDVNSVGVATPTTYYVYFDNVAGVPTAIASTTDPSTNPAVDEYFTANVIRFTSIGGTVRLLSCRYPAQSGFYELAHQIKEDVLYSKPAWVVGIAPTLSAGGKISTTAGFVRYTGNEPRAETLITEGTIVLDDETTEVAGIDNITTYSDGSTITATKWHKVLIGLKRDKQGILTTRLIAMRQDPPSTEYTSLSEAIIDAERVAATSFGINYTAGVTPLFYYVTEKGSYAGGQLIDVRTSGVVTGAGGGIIADHGSLSGLGDDDHVQYYNAVRHDTTTAHALGTVVPHDDHGALSGIADDDHTQYYNVTRHTKVLHDGLALEHGSLTGLADDDHTQYLLANGGRALSGNLSVNALVTIDGVDISAHAANASAHHAPVTLSAEADAVLQLSTQAIDLDTQTASYALMGPAAGASAAKPTFRAIVPADMLKTEGTLNLSNGQNDNVALTAGVDQYTVAGPTGAFGFSGFTGGYAGRRIVIMNSAVNKNMTAYHQNTSSTAANRIICPGAMADTATSNYGVMVFEYFATTQRWVMISIIT